MFLIYASLKMCQFHQEEVWFLGYMVYSKRIRMEDKTIEAVKQWPESQSVWDIQIFLWFANFYQRFIQGISWIATPLTLMLKNLGSTESQTWPGKGGVEVDGSRARRDRNRLDESRIDNVEVDGAEIGDDELGKKFKNCLSPEIWLSPKRW